MIFKKLELKLFKASRRIGENLNEAWLLVPKKVFSVFSSMNSLVNICGRNYTPYFNSEITHHILK